MPTYEDQIDTAEISSVVSQSGVQMQRVAEGLDKMNAQLSTMVDQFSKVRDYTQDELRVMAQYKSEIKGVADAYRSMHGERLKGMNDYSVALVAIEDQIKKNEQAEKQAIENTKKLREQSKRIDEAYDGRMTKAKKKALQEELGTEETNARKLRKIADEKRQDIDKEIRKNREVQKEAKKQIEQGKENLEVHNKLIRQGEKKIQQSRRQTDLLEMASDLHLPGVSHAATVAKYARRGYEGAASQQGDGGGGIMGMLSRGGGLLGGLAKGAGIVAGGYTALQGYRVYNAAGQMAPMARTLQGQVGAGAAGLRQQAVEAYGGYGGMENLQTQIQLNRALGGQAGAGQLRKVTDLANRFGLERGEVIGQAGAAFGAGMSPGTATQDLERIMSEGVKAGMDRARITQFTQEVLSVQQELFRATGENNAQKIAEAMAQLMRASGQGEKFLHGPAMQGIRGIDAAIKGAGRGQVGGQAAGTLFRAFGFGAGSQQGFGPDQYYEARRRLEGGLFGQEEGAVGTLGKVFGQYDRESGGNRQVSNLRMADELGIGIRQVEELRGIQEKAATGAITKEDIKRLEQIQEETKDPMLRLLDIQAKMDANIAKAAGSLEGIASVVAINQQILSAQQNAVEALRTIARALTGEGTEDQTGDMLKTGLGALGFGALMAPTAAAGLFSSSATGALGTAAGAGLGTAALGVGAAGLAGAAAGHYVVNPLLDKYTTEENRYGAKSNIAERGIAGLVEYGSAMLPESWGGQTWDQASKNMDMMYGKGPDPMGFNIAPRTGTATGPQGAAPRKVEVSDEANTSATSKNTAAMEKLTEVLIKNNGQPVRMSLPRQNGVNGSFR